MIISAFSDSEKKDKIAEFYDTTHPGLFMRGVLTEAQEQEKDIQVTFMTRNEHKACLSMPKEKFEEYLETSHWAVDTTGEK